MFVVNEPTFIYKHIYDVRILYLTEHMLHLAILCAWHRSFRMNFSAHELSTLFSTADISYILYAILRGTGKNIFYDQGAHQMNPFNAI